MGFNKRGAGDEFGQAGDLVQISSESVCDAILVGAPNR